VEFSVSNIHIYSTVKFCWWDNLWDLQNMWSK